MGKYIVSNNDNDKTKPEISIQLSFFFEIKLQKEHFLEKYNQFFN